MTRQRVDHGIAPVVGYTNRFAARPGERITVFASADTADCAVRVLRVSHDGTAPTHTHVDVPGVPERVRIPHGTFDFGSYGWVATPPALGGAVTFAAWVWLTAWPAGSAAVLSQGDPAGGAYAALSIMAGGGAVFEARTSSGIARAGGDFRLRLRRWYLLVGGYDPDRGAVVAAWPRDRLASEPRPWTADGPAAGDLVTGTPSLLVAGVASGGDVVGNIDGKIDAPAAWARRLGEREQAELAADRITPAQLGAVAAWDLSQDITGDRMIDVVGDHDGRLRNLPARAMTGHDWTGDVLDWRHAQRGYGAVHFHSDDLEDAGWAPVVTVTVTDDLAPGCYAVELTNEHGTDRVPFFVRPRPEAPRKPLLLLIPTLSYLAYALDHLRQPVLPEQPGEIAAEFARANRLHSMYDQHSDGSGVCVASILRPLLGMREDHVFRYTGGPHQYGEDVELIGWLDRLGIPYDVLTDHDLHAEGADALRGYRAVITGSHPEYWTGTMLDAVQSHVDGGGKLGYLGGNGAYWVTTIAPGRPHIAELRRAFAGVRTWQCEPGETHMSTTGEPGGLWWERGRSAHRLFGIGTTATGFAPGAAYELRPVDHPAATKILSDLRRSAPLGDFGSVLGAAASFETDCTDPLLGTPDDITVLGRAMLDESYFAASDGPAFGHPLGDPVDKRRADLTLLDFPGGGTVFSTGSIGWCGALSHNDDDNDVSRITAAVLRWFTEESR